MTARKCIVGKSLVIDVELPTCVSSEVIAIFIGSPNESQLIAAGPSTLGCAIAYLTAPDVFEPQLEKTLLLIVEVPVVCDEAQSDDDEDLRYVPEKSIRIVDRLGNANTDVGQLPIPVDHQKLQCPEGFRNWRRWGATAR